MQHDKAPHPPSPEAPRPGGEGSRLGRRLVVLRLAGLGAATALPGCVSVPGGHAPRSVLATTDADPADGAGQGRYHPAAPHRRGTTDNDPSDGVGRGRGVHAHPIRRAATDSDPSDDPGHGRRRR